MLEELINTFEKLKKYVFIIDIGSKGKIYVKFCDKHFYHLVGLHKINSFDMFLPDYLKTREKQYNYIKNNAKRFDKIINDLIVKQNNVKRRMSTLNNLLDLLGCEDARIYNLKERKVNSLYDGDYGISKQYGNICCLLGLKEFYKDENKIYCSPQSWIADNRDINLLKGRPAYPIKNITAIPIDEYNDEYL